MSNTPDGPKPGYCQTCGAYPQMPDENKSERHKFCPDEAGVCAKGLDHECPAMNKDSPAPDGLSREPVEEPFAYAVICEKGSESDYLVFANRDEAEREADLHEPEQEIVPLYRVPPPPANRVGDKGPK